jgi:hypothetical protein
MISTMASAQGQADEPAQRGAVDDCARTLLAHDAELMRHARPDAALVDRRDALEILERFIRGIRGRYLNAGIIEREVEATVFRDSAIDHRRHRRLVRDVAGHADRLAASAMIRSASFAASAPSISASTTAAPL